MTRAWRAIRLCHGHDWQVGPVRKLINHVASRLEAIATRVEAIASDPFMISTMSSS